MSRPSLHLDGMVFDRWTVLYRLPGTARAFWLCRCECGTEKRVYQNSLVRALSRSCGCLIGETAAANQYRHGHDRRGKTSRTYNIWASMKQRCLDPGCRSYKRYGGRGIKVCTEWVGSFERFLSDMGECPGQGYSIERRDNEKGYEPGNCRWTTAKEQARNRRTSRMIEFRNETHTLAAWAELTGIHSATITNRIDLYGWSIERALTQPPGPNGVKTHKHINPKP